MTRARIGWAAACAAGLIAAIGLFARLMNYDMRRDEQLYVSPAALIDTQRLYHDFFYNHVPGSAWLYDAAYEAFGAGGLLFSARLTLFLVWLAFAAAAGYFTWRLSRSALAAAAAVVFLVANDFLLGVVGALATAYALWTIYGAGLKPFVWGLALLAAGPPVYLMMKHAGVNRKAP